LSVLVKKKNPKNNLVAEEEINRAKIQTVATRLKVRVVNKDKVRVKLVETIPVAIKTATTGETTATVQTMDRAIPAAITATDPIPANPILVAITATDPILDNLILLVKAKTVGLKQKAEHH